MVGKINPTFFSRPLKGRCYGNRLIFGTNRRKLAYPEPITHPHSEHWHSTMNGRIATMMHAITPPMTLNPLHV